MEHKVNGDGFVTSNIKNILMLHTNSQLTEVKWSENPEEFDALVKSRVSNGKYSVQGNKLFFNFSNGAKEEWHWKIIVKDNLVLVLRKTLNEAQIKWQEYHYYSATHL